VEEAANHPLLDVARRYVNKARAAGTRAIVQGWGHMLHVWQMFYPEVREAGEAWDEIRRFLESTQPVPGL
jgi:epsilon-lactone hydrolase